MKFFAQLHENKRQRDKSAFQEVSLSDPELIPLLAELAAEEGTNIQPIELAVALEKCRAFLHCYGVKWNHELIAVTLSCFSQTIDEQGHAVPGFDLLDLVVTSRLRGKGVGSFLLTELQKTYARVGHNTMRWSLLEGNHPARAFYDALGPKLEKSNKFFLFPPKGSPVSTGIWQIDSRETHNDNSATYSVRYCSKKINLTLMPSFDASLPGVTAEIFCNNDEETVISKQDLQEFWFLLFSKSAELWDISYLTWHDQNLPSWLQPTGATIAIGTEHFSSNFSLLQE